MSYGSKTKIRLTWSAREIFCRLLITFANSLYQDQARNNAGPGPDPKLLDTLMVVLKEFLSKNIILKKFWQTTKNQANLPSMQMVKSGRIYKMLVRLAIVLS